MSYLSYGLIALGLGVIALLAFATTRPDEFRVERRLRIQAPPEQLWPLVSELRAFNRWNPYERKDPLIQGGYTGPASGIGSRYAWQSSKVGEGSLEITGQQPGRAVQMKLEFLRPFEAHNQAEFTLRAAADGATEVSWRMSGPANLMSKLMGLVMDVDRMVGRDFEDGLQNLRQIAEARS